MSRKDPLPQSRRHIMIYDEDWEYLAEMFGPLSERPIGPGKAAQKLIHGAVLRLKQQEQQELEKRQLLAQGQGART